MKTLITLISALIFLSATVKADGIEKNNKKSNKEYFLVAVAPFVMGDPNEDAPIELAYLKAKNALVPITPYVWADPSETAPAFLKVVKAKNAFVPVAPFVWGNPSEDLPKDLNLSK